MALTKWTGPAENGLRNVIKVLSWLACLSAAAMVLIVVVNVFGRFFFQWPLPGTMELVEQLMAPVCFFAMPYTAMLWGHVKIDLVIRRQTRHIQRILGSISFFLCLGIWGAITYRMGPVVWEYIQDLSLETDVLSIPYAPFQVVAILGSFVLCLILLVCVFRPLPPVEDEKK